MTRAKNSGLFVYLVASSAEPKASFLSPEPLKTVLLTRETDSKASLAQCDAETMPSRRKIVHTILCLWKCGWRVSACRFLPTRRAGGCRRKAQLASAQEAGQGVPRSSVGRVKAQLRSHSNAPFYPCTSCILTPCRVLERVWDRTTFSTAWFVLFGRHARISWLVSSGRPSSWRTSV